MLNNNWRWWSVITSNYACYEVLTLLPCFFFNVTPREMNHFSNCSPKCEWKSIRVPVDDMIKWTTFSCGSKRQRHVFELHFQCMFSEMQHFDMMLLQQHNIIFNFLKWVITGTWLRFQIATTWFNIKAAAFSHSQTTGITNR